MHFAPGTLFFFAIAAAIVGYFACRILRHGGFKAAMFGARIERTVGEVPGESQGIMSVVLRVHALRRGNSEKLIGIEIVAKTFGSYQMTRVTFPFTKRNSWLPSFRTRQVVRRVGQARSAVTHHLSSRAYLVGYAPSALTHPTCSWTN